MSQESTFVPVYQFVKMLDQSQSIFRFQGVVFSILWYLYLFLMLEIVYDLKVCCE